MCCLCVPIQEVYSVNCKFGKLGMGKSCSVLYGSVGSSGCKAHGPSTVFVWEIRKHKLYDSDSGSGLQLRTQSSPGERSGKFNRNGKFGQNGKFSQNGKFGQNGMSGQKGKVHLGPNVSSSAHYRGCVVNGSGAMAAI